MDVESIGIPLATFLLFLLLSVIFPPLSSEANQFLPNNTHTQSPPIPFHNLRLSSGFFPLKGSVHSNGGYTVTLNIGNPPKPYDLVVDTGGDLTWVQCDNQCEGCTLPRDKLYKPHNNFVECADPLCAVVQLRPRDHCPNPKAQCRYRIHCASGSSPGVLVRDYIPLKSPDGTLQNNPKVVFGCGSFRANPGPHPTTPPPGILGLGFGKESILSQLSSPGVIRNVVGHCLSGKGGGYLLFGDEFNPKSGIVWTPLAPQSASERHYMTGKADLLIKGKTTPVIKGLRLVFDSGCSYSSFNSRDYKTFEKLVLNDLKGKPLERVTDKEKHPDLRVCWKGRSRSRSRTRFRYVSDVKRYFNPLALSFGRSGKPQLELPLENYLVIDDYGNVCLGILDSEEEELDDLNVIGAVSR